jgi:hypothetical protein
MSGPEIHVVPGADDQWAVTREGTEAPLSLHATQAAAAEAGRAVAREDQVEFVLHGVDGEIREKDSYGHDRPDRKG